MLTPAFAYVVSLTTLASCGLIAIVLTRTIRGLDV
jgi:hypothetical protein